MFLSDQQVVLTSDNFGTLATGSHVLIGTTSLAINSSSMTEVTFTTPVLQAGTYSVKLYIEGVGYADMS